MVDWEFVATALNQGIAEQVAASDPERIRNPRAGRVAWVTPRLRNDFPASDTAIPFERDELSFSMVFRADRVGGLRPGGSVFTCEDLEATIEVDLEIEETDYLWISVHGDAMAQSCRIGGSPPILVDPTEHRRRMMNIIDSGEPL